VRGEERRREKWRRKHRRRERRREDRRGEEERQEKSGEITGSSDEEVQSFRSIELPALILILNPRKPLTHPSHTTHTPNSHPTPVTLTLHPSPPQEVLKKLLPPRTDVTLYFGLSSSQSAAYEETTQGLKR
jgi:hypothetical protein